MHATDGIVCMPRPVWSLLRVAHTALAHHLHVIDALKLTLCVYHYPRNPQCFFCFVGQTELDRALQMCIIFHAATWANVRRLTRCFGSRMRAFTPRIHAHAHTRTNRCAVL